MSDGSDCRQNGLRVAAPFPAAAVSIFGMDPTLCASIIILGELIAVQGRKPKQRNFSGIMRQDSIRKCVAQFLDVIIRLSRQTSRWRQPCDMLRNARAMLAYCSRNDVMTFTLFGASFHCRMLSHRVI